MENLMSIVFDNKENMKEQLYIDIMNCIMKAKVSVLRVHFQIINVHLEFDYDDNEIELHDTVRYESRIIRYKNHADIDELNKFMLRPFKPFRLTQPYRYEVEGLDGLFETEKHEIVVEGNDTTDTEDWSQVKTNWKSRNIVIVLSVEEDLDKQALEEDTHF